MTTHSGGRLPADLESRYRRFRATRYVAEQERYRQLGDGIQAPRAMVIACSDSRSSPDAIFDAGPGELFVLRNVAALVPVYAPDGTSHAASAAIEFAVLALHVPSIVVLGHGRCGGIQAALGNNPPLSSMDFVGTWVAGIRDLARQVEAAGIQDAALSLRELERRSVERSIANLRTFPWVASAEKSGVLRLYGAWFDISLGELHSLTDEGWAPMPDVAP